MGIRRWLRDQRGTFDEMLMSMQMIFIPLRTKKARARPDDGRARAEPGGGASDYPPIQVPWTLAS